jgi:hypothetical protein
VLRLVGSVFPELGGDLRAADPRRGDRVVRVAQQTTSLGRRSLSASISRVQAASSFAITRTCRHVYASFVLDPGHVDLETGVHS